MIKKHKLPVTLISQRKIQKRVGELARQIEKDYQSASGGKKPILICVLKGSFMLLADLIRCLKIPVECDFVAISSYGTKTVSSGKIKLKLNISHPIKNRNVIIIEDIVDTGLTTNFLINKLKQLSPKNIRLCTLLDKPDRRKIKVKIDYCGFRIPDKFVVGYGMDYNEQYRYLPYVGYIR